MPTFDVVVIYVSNSGGEYMIRYAAEHHLDASKALFVMCGCHDSAKKQLLAEHGFGKSRIMISECAGRDTLAHVARKFLETGQLAA